jgi:hypothetical protein
MQSRYIPDLGDFSKLGLLRSLAGSGTPNVWSVGIVWYLTDPERDATGKLLNHDGRRPVAYLTAARPDFFRVCDPALYDALRRLYDDCLRDAGRQDVREYRRRGILGVPARFAEGLLTFSGVPVRNRRRMCEGWFGRVLADLVAPGAGQAESEILRARASEMVHGPWGDHFALIESEGRRER